MATWLVPLQDLTTDQLRAVRLPHGNNRIIMGGPGSGKTIVLLHRARHLVDKLNLPEDQYRIFVYTGVLKDYIRSAAELLNLPNENIVTFDSWCQDYYKSNINRVVPLNGRKPNFVAIRQGVLSHLRDKAGAPIYDFVMVDEGQDLSPIFYEILTLISKHTTVCMDRKQQLYDTGSDEEEIKEWLGIPNTSVNLLEGYRCSIHVVNLASSLILDDSERNDFINQTRVVTRDIETPLLYFANSAMYDERDRLISIVKTRQMNNEKVGILFPRRNQVFGYAQAMRENGIEVEDLGSLDFASDRPKLLTYHGAKGLTFDTVILPRLVRGSFYNLQQDYIRRQIFVAISRATKWVYMSTVRDQELSIIKELMDSLGGTRLTIQRSGQADAIPTNQQTDKDQDLLDLF